MADLYWLYCQTYWDLQHIEALREGYLNRAIFYQRRARYYYELRTANRVY